jgi:hypothetical protein
MMKHSLLKRRVALESNQKPLSGIREKCAKGINVNKLLAVRRCLTHGVLHRRRK